MAKDKTADRKDKTVEHDGKLKAIFNDEELNTLRGNAKRLIVEKDVLTIGDLWRFSGWKRGDEPDPVNDPVLKDVSMDDLKSIADACAKRAIRLGNSPPAWRYVGNYSCCACTACCAVVVSPYSISDATEKI
jgi:hypothetical protein